MKKNTLSSLNISKGSIPPLIRYKIVLLGDQSVGKSSIINRFIHDIFDPADNRPTIGIDFICQNIYLEEKVIRLQIWDTAGQERFRTLIPNYLRDSAVAILVFDLASRPSFNSLSGWIDDIYRERGSDVIVCLVGNKADVTSREVSSEEAEEIARQHKMPYKEISAKTGLNVQELFREVAALLPGTDLKRMTETSIPTKPDSEPSPQP